MWERLLEALIDEPDFEWLMIDASYVKVHAHGVPVRMKITEGTASDSSLALELIDGIDAEHLLADKGYDSDAVVSGVLERGIKPVIPPRRNRKEPREYDFDYGSRPSWLVPDPQYDWQICLQSDLSARVRDGRSIPRSK